MSKATSLPPKSSIQSDDSCVKELEALVQGEKSLRSALMILRRPEYFSAQMAELRKHRDSFQAKMDALEEKHSNANALIDASWERQKEHKVQITLLKNREKIERFKETLRKAILAGEDISHLLPSDDA